MDGGYRSPKAAILSPGASSENLAGSSSSESPGSSGPSGSLAFPRGCTTHGSPNLDWRSMDTPLEVARLQAELMRRMGPLERWRRVERWSAELLAASRARAVQRGLAAGLDEHDALEQWVREQHGPEVAKGYGAYRRSVLGGRGRSA